MEETALESLLRGLWGGWAQPLQELLKVTGVSGVRPSGTFPTAFCSPGPCVDSQGTLSQEPHPEGRTPHCKHGLWGQLQTPATKAGGSGGARQEVRTKVYFKPEFREMRGSCTRGQWWGAAGRRRSLGYTDLSALVFHIFLPSQKGRP